jgi:hypothetical protein
MNNLYNTEDTGDTGRTQHDFTERIGIVAVDSGLLVIVDPAYTATSSGLNCATSDELYDECCTTRTGPVMPPLRGDGRLAVSLGDFGGDGVFPVYAERDEHGLTSRVVIDFTREQFDANTGDESAILDGEQGIASRLHDLPDGFVDFAHRRITEWLAVADEADKMTADAACPFGRKVPTLYRRAHLSATAMAMVGHPPHRDERVQLRRDNAIETALHNLVDALVDEWATHEITTAADFGALYAIRALRSPDIVLVPESEVGS